MFDQYGPNSLKVNAFIKALRNLADDVFALLGPRTIDSERLGSLLKRIDALESERLDERVNAYRDALDAVKDKGSEIQRKFAAGLATMLVLEDRLKRDEKVFLSLFLVYTIVPGRLLYADYKKEDRAVEDFCEQLWLIDGQEVYVKSRPDERGQGGAGLPDFIISRAGKDFTVEHTSVDTYPNQVFFEKLWAKYFKPLKIEEKIKQAYPKGFIHISIPINVFKRESEARKFDFEKFVQDLIDAVAKTPKGRYGKKRKRYNLPFPVDISNDEGDGFVGCYVIQIVPTHEEQRDVELEKEIAKAVIKKRKKLKEAKDRGESTILLIDSDDYALVNEEILADAFARAVGHDPAVLDGIDEVYIQHRRGKCWLVPVKLDDRLYPDLPEFDEYRYKQWKML
jgi:hypothetical protein